MASMIEWDNSYLLGNTVIDEQHQQLISFIIELYNAELANCKKNKTKILLISIYSHIINHCDDEEALMEHIDYKFRIAHELEHYKFLTQLESIIEKSKSNNGRIYADTLVWLTNWSKNHVLVSDKQLVASLPIRG